MAQLEDMRLPAAAREALVNDPNFLRQLVEAALNRFLDAEITEHLRAHQLALRQLRHDGLPSTGRLRSRPPIECGKLGVP